MKLHITELRTFPDFGGATTSSRTKASLGLVASQKTPNPSENGTLTNRQTLVGAIWHSLCQLAPLAAAKFRQMGTYQSGTMGVTGLPLLIQGKGEVWKILPGNICTQHNQTS